MIVLFSANSFEHIYKLRIDVIKHIKDQGHEIYAVAANDNYRNKLEKCGVNIISVKIQANKKNIFSDLSLLLQYYKIFKKINPHILFNSTIKSNIYGSIVSNLLNIKTINNISGLGTTFLQSNILKWFVIYLYKFSQKNVHKIYFQNKADLNLFEKLKISNTSKSKLIPGSGVNSSKFKRSKKLIPSTKINFLFIGRLVKEKGLNELITAFAQYLDSYEASLIIAGQYNKNNPSSIKMSNFMLSEEKNITYIGHKKNVKKLLEEVDCLILPSYREGLSNVVLEALSMEVPVIASNVPGCKELIIHGKNGFLCEPRSPDSLYRQIVKFHNLASDRKIDMGIYGRKLIKEKYDIKFLYKIYMEDL